jgi:uncharacterized membrane protein YidH (DUF202 family)
MNEPNHRRIYGLAGPRTALAWDRTALAAAALAALIVKVGIAQDRRLDLVAGAAWLATGAVSLLVPRRRVLPPEEGTARVASPGSVAVVAAFTTAAALLTIVALLL